LTIAGFKKASKPQVRPWLTSILPTSTIESTDAKQIHKTQRIIIGWNFLF